MEKSFILVEMISSSSDATFLDNLENMCDMFGTSINCFLVRDFIINYLGKTFYFWIMLANT